MACAFPLWLPGLRDIAIVIVEAAEYGNVASYAIVSNAANLEVSSCERSGRSLLSQYAITGAGFYQYWLRRCSARTRDQFTTINYYDGPYILFMLKS